MELLANEELYFKSPEDKEQEYRDNIDNALEKIVALNDRLVFFNVVKEADISSIDIYRHPGLRSYILEKIKEKKIEIYIDKKINRVVSDLVAKDKKVSFVTVMNRCKFTQEELKDNPIIKDKIRRIVIKEGSNYYKNRKKGKL